MQNFAFIGDYLMKKYNKAKMVELEQHTGGLKSTRKSQKGLRKADIVYMENSPDYCEFNVNQGRPNYLYLCGYFFVRFSYSAMNLSSLGFKF